MEKQFSLQQDFTYPRDQFSKRLTPERFWEIAVLTLSKFSHENLCNTSKAKASF